LQSEGTPLKRRSEIWWASLLNRIPRLAELETYPSDGIRAGQEYAQAADFMAFAINTTPNGWEKIKQLLKLIKTDKNSISFNEAFQTAFGRSISTMEQQWRTKLFKRRDWLVKLTDDAVWLGLAAILCIIGFIVVKKRKKIRLLEMEQEEAPLENTINAIELMIEEKQNSETSATTDITPEIEVDGQKFTLH
jgi:uncharacterized membrane protein YcjF (UPF0283 family)